MANFGLSRPWIASYDEETDTYSNAFRCGRLVNTSVTPNYVSAGFYADNNQVEDVQEFQNAAISLGIDTVPVQGVKVLFGHEVGEDGVETDNTADAGVFVGYGFVTAQTENGKKKYRACLLRKAKFTEGEESYQTKGDSVQFTNPTLSGTAYGVSNTKETNGEWRIKSPLFDTETEADEWIQNKLGVTKTS